MEYARPKTLGKEDFLTATNPILAASPETWSHQTAYASLKASAKHFAGLENARMLIRQSRQFRYLRNVQLAHAAIEAKRAEEESAEIGQLLTPAEGEILVQAA